MNELISVIVPVYNTGVYLEACVESIIHQDYPNIEIIIVDDGSKDEQTLSICDILQNKYNNVVVYHKSNGGLSDARNYGLEVSQGKYVAFVDSDDTISPTMYSKLYEAIQREKTQIAVGGMCIEDNGFTYVKDQDKVSCTYDRITFLHHFLLGSWHSACVYLYEKKLFSEQKFPLKEINEDYFLNYKILKNVDNIAFVNEPFYHYYKHAGSITTSNISKRILDWVRHTEYILNDNDKSSKLRGEAEYQYLFAYIVIGNKSLITLNNHISEVANELYIMSSRKLRENLSMIKDNKYFTIRHKMMAISLAIYPQLYRFIVLNWLKFKGI